MIDTGKWYYLKFSDITNAFVCEKDLMTMGNIENFEKMFEGKVKREKINKKVNATDNYV